ncbi:MAG: hypothetical protein EOM20_14385 [Spartobacteria bacterium]|nr:hypothetical protein [Spartobacteria bacterium]
MANIINKIMYALSYALMAPFRGMSPWLALVWISALVGFFALLIFKYFSSQERLTAAKQVVFARVLEFRLFRHDVWSVFGIFGRVLLSTGGYLRFAIKPFFLLFVPLVLLLFQLAGWFEWRPLRPGESALVHARMGEEQPLADKNRLVASPSLLVETPGVAVRSEHMMVWRVKALAPDAAAWLETEADGESVRKAIVISEDLVQVSPARVSGFWAALENPGEVALPSDAAWESIRVAYPRRHFRIGHWDIHWIVALFLISMVFGLVLKKPMRVDF